MNDTFIQTIGLAIKASIIGALIGLVIRLLQEGIPGKLLPKAFCTTIFMLAMIPLTFPLIICTKKYKILLVDSIVELIYEHRDNEWKTKKDIRKQVMGAWGFRIILILWMFTLRGALLHFDDYVDSIINLINLKFHGTYPSNEIGESYIAFNVFKAFKNNGKLNLSSLF